MRLITASQLAKNYFAEGSRPSKARIKTWVDDGLIEGKEIRGTLYVDEASFVRFYHDRDRVPVEKATSSEESMDDAVKSNIDKIVDDLCK